MQKTNFPKITLSQSAVKTQAVVATFKNSEDGVVTHPLIPVGVLSVLDKSDVTVVVNDTLYSMVYLKPKAKKQEKLVADAIAKLSSSVQDVLVLTDVSNVKSFASALIVGNVPKWTAKSTKEETVSKSITVLVDETADMVKLEDDLSKGVALAESVALKMRLIDMPSNYLTPTALLQEAQAIANSSKKATLSVVSGKDLENAGYGSLYAVSKGSVEAGHLITVEYKGGSDGEAPLVLVGKGLTFDSGGISIKPSRGMGSMKGDMGGAATVLGCLQYAIATKAQKNIVAIIATCENMPDAAALKPGDVITAKNGKTIEVEDTDAEGRLVLADALCHAQTFNGALTVDFATLTGAVISAIGHVHTGLFTECDVLAQKFSELGNQSGDTVWRLPLSDDYSHFLDSDVADMNNLCIGQGAGATNGAVFLREFAPKQNWVHLDIAGTSDHNGSTGRPIGLMSEIIDE